MNPPRSPVSAQEETVVATAEPAPKASRRTVDRVPTAVSHLLVIATALVLLCAWAASVDGYRAYQIATVGALFCGAAGLTVLTGSTGQISVGHGAFMAVGGYTVALTQPRLIEAGWDMNAALLLSLALAVVVTTLFGTIFGVAGARIEGPYLAGLTLALLIAVPAAASLFSDVLKGENGIGLPYLTPPEFLGPEFAVERWQAWVALTGAAVVAVIFANLMATRQGRAWRATKDDPAAAALCGVNVRRMRIEAFALSSGAAGLGGGLLAVLIGQASPATFGLHLSVQILTAIVLGGLGSLLGALLGSAFVVFFPSWLTTFIMDLPLDATTAQRLQGNAPLFAYGLGVVLVVIFAPRGLAGGLQSGRRMVGTRLSRARQRRSS